MSFKANELYSHYKIGSRYYLQVPDWLFLKGDSYLFAAKLFDMTKLEFFQHMRDEYEVDLVNYKTFIGFTVSDEKTIRKIVSEFNKRLRKKLRAAVNTKGGRSLMREGQRFIELRVSGASRSKKARKVVEIDNFKKYEEMKEVYGSNLEDKTMSSPVLKEYLKSVDFGELALTTLCDKQNLGLDDFLMLVDRNEEEGVFTRRSIQFHYFDSNRLNNKDFKNLIEVIVDRATGCDAEDFSNYLCGYNYGRLIAENEINYKTAKESLVYLIDSLMKVPIDFFEEVVKSEPSYLISGLNELVNNLTNAIKTTYVIPKEDSAFIIDYLFGGKIINNERVVYFDKKFLGSAYDNMHKSFFDKDLIEKIFDQMVGAFERNSMKLELSNMNPYINSCYFDCIGEPVTVEEFDRLLGKIGKRNLFHLKYAIYHSKVDIADSLIEEYFKDMPLKHLISNKSICKWFHKEGLTEKHFEELVELRSDHRYIDHCGLGHLQLTREQIEKYLKVNSTASNDRVLLKSTSLIEAGVDLLEEYFDYIAIDLSDMEDVSDLPIDLAVFLMRQSHVSRAAVLDHESLSKDNPIPLKVTKKFIESSRWGLGDVYSGIANGKHYEIDDEVLEDMISEMHRFTKESTFISKMGGNLNDLIELFSKKEMI